MAGGGLTLGRRVFDPGLKGGRPWCGGRSTGGVDSGAGGGGLGMEGSRGVDPEVQGRMLPKPAHSEQEC